MKELFGQRLREQRIKHGLTLEQLAEKSELSSNYIGMVERGLKEPGLATIVKLLNALNISADTLLCDLVPSASHVTDDEIRKRLEGLTPIQKKAALDLLDTTDQFIWESPKTGLPCNPTHFRDVFRKSLEEAGDVRLLTPHSCRHTYVSQMQALGVDIQTIQSIVGHADTEMTEHYLHVQESIRQSAIQLFSEAFSA